MRRRQREGEETWSHAEKGIAEIFRLEGGGGGEAGARRDLQGGERKHEAGQVWTGWKGAGGESRV